MIRPAPPADLLDRPAGEAVRLIALSELERAAQARDALAAGEDPEALHDFRVALRRLRSQLRAFRSAFDDAVPKRLRRELQAVATATGSGRDAEVGLDWLARLGPPASARSAPGWTLYRDRLASTHGDALDNARSKLAPTFDRIRRRLAARLSAWTVELSPQDVPDRFRDLAARELDRHRSALGVALEAIADPEHDDEVHRARIEAKRVRYLLDPLAGALRAAQPALDRLRALQDLLGELNDLRVLATGATALAAELEAETVSRVAREGAVARRRRPRARTGLLELAERIAAERDQRWRKLEAGWIGASAPARAALDAELTAVERALGR